MALPIDSNREKNEKCGREPSYQAFQILRFAFTIAPILAGLDKFFNFLTNWTQYLSSPFDVFGAPHTTMMVVGVIEIIAGILVWVKPKIFAYVVAAWLLAIIINLLILGRFYDVALRDLGLLLGALALARLSVQYDHCCCKKSS
ncbi:hypothetical protein ACFLR2_00785 [Chlamydiota bacterium]